VVSTISSVAKVVTIIAANVVYTPVQSLVAIVTASVQTSLQLAAVKVTALVVMLQSLVGDIAITQEIVLTQ